MIRRDLLLLDPVFRPVAETVATELVQAGIPLRPYETIRPPSRQTQLYGRGRDPRAVDYGRTVTKARAYQSAHQYGLAVDFVFFIDGEWTWDPPRPGDWEVFAGIARSAGAETLSFEKPHIQLAGFDWRQLEKGPDNDNGWLAWLKARNA